MIQLRQASFAGLLELSNSKSQIHHSEHKLLSAHDIKNVNNFSTMNVYAFVSVSGGTNPKWNHNSSLKFMLHDAALSPNRLTLKIELVSERVFFRTKIGEALISVNELVQNCGQDNKHVTCPLSTQGTLSFGYRFGPPPHAQAHKPYMGCPVGSSSGYPQPGAPHPNQYPPQPGYGTHFSYRLRLILPAATDQ